MNIKIERPEEIESKSFEFITILLGDQKLDPKYEHIIKRCIHTSADFDYADNLFFSENVLQHIENAIKSGCRIVTDTQMAKVGINKTLLEKFGTEIQCFIGDEDVAKTAKEKGITRSAAAVEKAAAMEIPTVYVVGNAPTALLKLYELIEEKGYKPEGIIGVPVGFVNVIESKDLIMKSPIPCIVAKGRKGGSNIGAAICNAILKKI